MPNLTARAFASCSARHNNKLRAGHLHGNRFRIVVRDADRNVDVQAIVERIRTNGLPNFYGNQRFGHDGETLLLGQALIYEQPLPPLADGRRPNLRNPFLRKLALSAVQSALFNQYLARRMNDGLMRQVLPGDVMAKWPFGGMFVAEDVPAEQARFDRREIVSAGPIFGRKTFPAKNGAAEREAAVLREANLSRDSFARFGKLLMGSRRHNLVYVDDLTADLQLESLQLTFTLPAGSYATVLLRNNEDQFGRFRAGRGSMSTRQKFTRFPGKAGNHSPAHRVAVGVVTIVMIFCCSFFVRSCANIV